MPFIPHTEADIEQMLKAIDVSSIDQLFDEIPDALRIEGLDIADGMNEMAVTRHMKALAAKDADVSCFAGAGAYEHHIPAAVWEITTRGEFYSAYTPYQAEASQGTLQVIYEYQSMMAALLDMEVSNASLYDGASGLAEAVLMALRANRKSRSRRVLVPESVHPIYRQVLSNLVSAQEIVIETLSMDAATGKTHVDELLQRVDEDIAAVVIPQPNFFGVLEDVDALTDAAAGAGALSVAVVNPMAMSVLKPPGQWGEKGADIACGEGQPLGVPLSSGGPYFGFLCCRQSLVRQMPGRLVGRTTDLDGNPGFALTLQAREQHIRRAKATSNICTNQGLLVTAATIYLSLMGASGLEKVAAASHRNTRALVAKLCAIDGVTQVYSGPYFHECAVRLPVPAAEVIESLAEQRIVPGFDLSSLGAGQDNDLLVCVTETKTEDDIDRFVSAMESVLQS
ncbi:MAG: aminomethyl-transferring glycine dehydrogenase subunit GcvPA [Lysobacterales bacterium]